MFEIDYSGEKFDILATDKRCDLQVIGSKRCKGTTRWAAVYDNHGQPIQGGYLCDYHYPKIMLFGEYCSRYGAYLYEERRINKRMKYILAAIKPYKKGELLPYCSYCGSRVGSVIACMIYTRDCNHTGGELLCSYICRQEYTSRVQMPPSLNEGALFAIDSGAWTHRAIMNWDGTNSLSRGIIGHKKQDK